MQGTPLTTLYVSTKLILTITLWVWYHLYTHFIDEETCTPGHKNAAQSASRAQALKPTQTISCVIPILTALFPHGMHYRTCAVTFAIFSFSNVSFWIVSTFCIFITLTGTILKVACYLIHLCILRRKTNSLPIRVPWKGAPRHIYWGKKILKKFSMSSVDLINWCKACSMLYLTGNPRLMEASLLRCQVLL